MAKKLPEGFGRFKLDIRSEDSARHQMSGLMEENKLFTLWVFACWDVEIVKKRLRGESVERAIGPDAPDTPEEIVFMAAMLDLLEAGKALKVTKTPTQVAPKEA